MKYEQARNKSVGKDAVLTLESCELELKVTVSAEGGGGFKVWFVDLSTKGSAERASTITLRFGSAGSTGRISSGTIRGRLQNLLSHSELRLQEREHRDN